MGFSRLPKYRRIPKVFLKKICIDNSGKTASTLTTRVSDLSSPMLGGYLVWRLEPCVIFLVSVITEWESNLVFGTGFRTGTGFSVF
jgi:hypothetical protein